MPSVPQKKRRARRPEPTEKRSHDPKQEKIDMLRDRLQVAEKRLAGIADELTDAMFPLESRLTTDGPKVAELGREYKRTHAEGLRMQRSLEDLLQSVAESPPRRACSTYADQVIERGMPKCTDRHGPERIKVEAGPIRMPGGLPMGTIYYQVYLCREPIYLDGIQRRGLCDGDTRKIFIDANIPLDQRINTFWHEYAHAVHFELDVHQRERYDWEAIANLMSLGLSQLSPGLMEAILNFLCTGATEAEAEAQAVAEGHERPGLWALIAAERRWLAAR